MPVEVIDNTTMIQDKRQSQNRLRVVLLTIVLSLITVFTVRGKPWSNGNIAATLGIVNTSLLMGAAYRQRDRGLGCVILFGAVFGVVELLADALCVAFTRTLDYSPSGSAMLFLSPWWMPIAWLVVSVQIGYLGAWVIDRIGLVRGALLTALFGAINIPFYEEMARFAHWWQYDNCHMLPGTHTPVYIVIAELLIGLCLGPLVWITLRATSWRQSIGYGLLGGLSTIIGGLLGYGLVEWVVPLLSGTAVKL
jgi:hypothetical protein